MRAKLPRNFCKNPRKWAVVEAASVESKSARQFFKRENQLWQQLRPVAGFFS
jgi:hypothetical protein